MFRDPLFSSVLPYVQGRLKAVDQALKPLNVFLQAQTIAFAGFRTSDQVGPRVQVASQGRGRPLCWLTGA